MPRRTALIVMTVSILLLIAAGTVWVVQGSGDGSADLVGAPETTTTTHVDDHHDRAEHHDVDHRGASGGARRTVHPSLGVESQVVPVGLEPNGEMEVPPADQAGWYFYGPRPGEADGTAVIAAHVDYGGQRGVFFDLRSLQVGAEIVVTDEAGAPQRFVVTERYQVDKDQLPIEQIFVADGPPGLTLITCGGDFDGGARSYRDNIVVRAVPA